MFIETGKHTQGRVYYTWCPWHFSIFMKTFDHFASIFFENFSGRKAHLLKKRLHLKRRTPGTLQNVHIMVNPALNTLQNGNPVQIVHTAFSTTRRITFYNWYHNQ